jgi:hypothetical protein
MRNPKDYPKALAMCQTFVTLSYLVSRFCGLHRLGWSLLTFILPATQVIGGVVYHYCGQYVASPALGSAGPLLKKICYGLALPGLAVGMVLNTHLPAKYSESRSNMPNVVSAMQALTPPPPPVFVRLLRNSRHLSENTPRHWIFWL